MASFLQVCKLSIPGEGSAPAKDYYFQASTVYKNGDIATATGITAVNDFENDEPLITIEQLILSKKIVRLVAELKNGTRRKTATILASRAKAASLLTDNSLNGKAFTVVGAGGASKTIGTIADIRSATRDKFK